MNEKELIGKIRELRQIKPKKRWVLLTKRQIVGEEKMDLSLFPAVYAGLFFFLILIGLFEFSQTALPGEPLYPLKRISEKAQAIFVSQEEQPKLNLELANKRLEELSEIVEKNEVKKLAPAITEFQANAVLAAKNLAKVKKIDKEIVAQTKKLEENKERVEEILATKIEIEEYDNALAKLVEREIKDLESRSLTEEQQELLTEAKEDFEAGNYSEALVKILNLSYPQE